MTVQSSFLIRCWLNAAGDASAGTPYYVQHVQTGAEFRAASLCEVTEWMAAQNARFLEDAR